MSWIMIIEETKLRNNRRCVKAFKNCPSETEMFEAIDDCGFNKFAIDKISYGTCFDYISGTGEGIKFTIVPRDVTIDSFWVFDATQVRIGSKERVIKIFETEPSVDEMRKACMLFSFADTMNVSVHWDGHNSGFIDYTNGHLNFELDDVDVISNVGDDDIGRKVKPTDHIMIGKMKG